MNCASWLGLHRVFAIFAALALVCASPLTRAQSNAEELRILRVTPAGRGVPSGGQITIKFDRDMVHLGQVATDAYARTITLQPTLNCQWRWLDTRTFACMLPAKQVLSRATRYRLHLQTPSESNPWRAVDGSVLRDAMVHEFETQRPLLRQARIERWVEPGRAYLRLFFNQTVRAESVRQHLYISGPGLNRVALALFPYSDLARRQINGEALSDSERAQLLRDREKPARAWFALPRESLPIGSSLVLKQEPGLLSVEGPLPGDKAGDALAINTFPQFKLLGWRCTDVDTGKVLSERISLPDRAPASRAVISGSSNCDPLGSIGFEFSSPVLGPALGFGLRSTPALDGGRKDYDPWRNHANWSRLRGQRKSEQAYMLWLPERLAAFTEYQFDFDAERVTDEFGRKLQQPLSIRFRTAHRRSRLQQTHERVVLEQFADSEFPVTVTNLEELEVSYSGLHAGGQLPRSDKRIAVPKAKNIAFAMPLGVRALLNDRSGVLSGRVNSNPVDRTDKSMAFFAQVTPFQVTAKIGHFSSLVWVTDMRTGQPVADAKVVVYQDRLAALQGPDGALVNTQLGGTQSAGSTRFGPYVTGPTGVVRLPGSVELDPKLERLGYYADWQDPAPRLFVHVSKGQSIALLPLDAHFSVNDYSVQNWQRPRYGHLRAWGTTAQGVYRVGDTVQYKIFVRQQGTLRLTPPPSRGYRLEVIDPKGDLLMKRDDLALSQFGAMAGELHIPDGSPVGWYRFKLIFEREGQRKQLDALRVLVADFTPAPFKVKARTDSDAYQVGDKLGLDISANWHAGGPYSDGLSRALIRLRATGFQTDHPIARDFKVDTVKPGQRSWRVLFDKAAKLNADGSRNWSVALADSDIVYGRLQVEGSVRDDRGKRVAATTGARFIARDRFVGLRNTEWVYSMGKPMPIEQLVLDGDGVPLANVPLAARVEYQETYLARVKSAGNAYVKRYEQRWVAVGGCQDQSRATEAVTCALVPQRPGYYRITARVSDSQGRIHESRVHAWVAGKGHNVWAGSEDETIEIVPEKTQYGVGETVKLLVKNPLPGALALISVERYGVLESWTERLESSTPIISFEVKPDHIPGIFVSLSLFSPRVAAAAPKRGELDLGKPAARFGYVRLEVPDPHKRIDLTIKTDRPVYKPREKVKLNIKAQLRHSFASELAASREPVELAIAVLDESVLDLVQGGTRPFDPYQGFYSLDALDVATFSLMKRLLGRQHFEKKGQSAGGDGGAMDADKMRSLFKFVSFWAPEVAVDGQGEAQVEFEVPDNLTGWRVLVMASTKEDQFGLGQTAFKVNKSTELRPVMPNQLLDGDRAIAGFSVLNRTRETRDIDVEVRAAGAATPVEIKRRVRLGPFERETINVELQAQLAPGQKDASVSLSARAGDSGDVDSLIHELPVLRRSVFENLATHDTIDLAGSGKSLQVPEAIHPNTASVSISLSRSLLGDLRPSFDYMQNYPYACWEQRLSKGLAGAQFLKLSELGQPLGEWAQARELARKTAAQAGKFQAPNGGMSYWVAQNRRVSPFLSAYTALALSWLDKAGFASSTGVRERLNQYLKRLLSQDQVPQHYNASMTASVRALALAALAEAGELDAAQIERFAPQLEQMSVFARAHFLDAARLTGAPAAIRDRALDALLSGSIESAGKLSINQTDERVHRSLLSTPARANCAALSSLIAAADDPLLARRVDDLAMKLARHVGQNRTMSGAFANTQENVFCLRALSEYAARFEQQVDAPVRVSGDLDGETIFERQPLAGLGERQDAPQSMTVKRELPPSKLGRPLELALTKDGSGSVYYSTRLQFAPLDAGSQPTNSGMEIYREYSVERGGNWERLQSPYQLRQGELVRVDLFVHVPTERYHVVVDDPVPGGLEPVNRTLATTSTVDAENEQIQARQWALDSHWHQRSQWMGFGEEPRGFGSGFYHRELRFNAVRYFSERLAPGHYHLRYVAQVIAAGEFSIQPAQVAQMYDPDVYGQSRAASLQAAP